MFVDPAIGERIHLDGDTYEFTEATNAPGIIYAEIGRKAKVYRLLMGKLEFALKVFKPKYRSKKTASNAKRISKYQAVPCLAVADRLVVSPINHPDLIKQNSAFAYSILMPWVEGKSWFNFVTGKVPLNQQQSVRLAHGLASAVSELETRDLAHCDLSSSNFIFTPDFSHVELVDIEDMFGHDLLPPKGKPKGTGGYAPHWIQENGVWEAGGDRFAAGILIAEILGWQFDELREASAGDAYFAEGEFGNKSKRFRLLSERLEQIHPELANLFKTVWYAESLEECPRISDWMKSLPVIQDIVPNAVPTTVHKKVYRTASATKQQPQLNTSPTKKTPSWLIPIAVAIAIFFIFIIATSAQSNRSTQPPAEISNPTELSATQDANPMLTQIQQYYSAGYLPTTEGRYYQLSDFEQNLAKIGDYLPSPTGRTAENFVLSANLEWSSAITNPDPAGCGFVFRLQGHGDHYFAVVTNWQLKVGAKIPGVSTKPFDFGVTRGNGRVYYYDPANVNFVIIVNQNHLYIFLDGNFQAEYTLYTDKLLDSGNLDYAVYSGTNKDYGTRCKFEHVQLWVMGR